MALPYFVAATGHVYINNTPKAVSVPAGTQSGDTLIAFITGEAGNTGAVNYPAGWTQLQRNPADGFRDSFIMAIATSDGSASYNFSTVGPNSAITIVAYRGVTAIGNSGIVLYDGTAGSNAATPVLAIAGSDVLEVMGCAYVDGRTATITGPAGSTSRVARDTVPTLNVSDIAVSGSNTTAKNFTLSVSGVKRSTASVLLAGAASGGGTPVSFSGTVSNQTATVGTAFNLNLSGFFAGSLTPFTYDLVAGSLAGTGLSLDAETGVISGTPSAAATISGLQVRATDSANNTAQTNTFSVTVAAAATPVSFSGSVSNQSATVGSAFSLSLASFFSGSLTPFSYSLLAGSLTGTGLSLNASTGVISGTPTSATTISGLQVRATDAGSNTAQTNSFSITVAAAGGTGVVTLTDLSNNANVPLANTTGITLDFYNVSTGALVVRKTGLTSTAGADLVVSDASLVTGTTYNVLISIGAAIGAAKVTAA